MAINFPGPYGLRLFYSTNGFVHKQEFSLDIDEDAVPGDDFADLHALTRTGVSINSLDVTTDAYVEIWADLNNDTNATLLRAELWEYVPLSFDATFIATHDINRQGDIVTPIVVASEQIYTFRTVGGGTMRIHFEEGLNQPQAPINYANMSAEQQALVDYILGATCPFIGRDGTFPVSFLRLFPGQNEAAFKRVFRP